MNAISKWLNARNYRYVDSVKFNEMEAGTQKSENLIEQVFQAPEPNIKLLTDITEVETADGKL